MIEHLKDHESIAVGHGDKWHFVKIGNEKTRLTFCGLPAYDIDRSTPTLMLVPCLPCQRFAAKIKAREETYEDAIW